MHAYSLRFDSVTLQTIAHQVPLFMGFSRQEYCSGLPFPPLGDLSNSGIKLMPPASPALAGRFFFLTPEPPRKPLTKEFKVIFGVIELFCILIVVVVN